MVARSYRHLLLVVCVGWAITPVAAADDARLRAALESVTADELYAHVATLADDVFEGRGVGSRGGYAAAQYILGELRPCGLRPAGTDGDYFQLCDDGGRNILGVLPGSDPRLQQEYIIVGAHYDHVGDGRRGRANGPIGSIFNGADDNASGVATLLETIEALAESGVGVRRSILFAFWDGEEVGLVGSKRWFDAPTIPPNAVRMTINIDMVGRLRDGQLQVLGTRTGYGMRRLLSGELDDRLQLDFSWELTGNSDHWPFVEHQIPAVMLHTGLHDDYHRPSDDVEKINPAGMEVVTRYLLARLIAVANVEALPAYRATGRYETLAMQRRATERIQYVSRGGWPGAAPPRRHRGPR